MTRKRKKDRSELDESGVNTEPLSQHQKPEDHDLEQVEPNQQETAHGETLQLSEAEVLETLLQGVIKEEGLLPYSSNHSFLVVVHDDRLTLPAVYKPQRGESPLWDFEWGTLCKRETAAYLLSAALSWDIVPPTVLRNGTRGIGSVQFYVDNDTDAHYFTVADDARFGQTFRQLALFDFVVNNADRKSGHCLVGTDSRMWAIDHGICFHDEFKLRTVIWEFSEQPIEDDYFEDLTGVRDRLLDSSDGLALSLNDLLSRHEYSTLVARITQLLQSGHYPKPSPFRRNFPWPPI